MPSTSPARLCHLALRALASLLLLGGTGAQAASSCSSDGQAQPRALVERFLSADCADCWTDAATVKPGRSELALDWIVPGSQGEEAPLSAAANRDGLQRLQALGRPVPATAEVARSPRRGAGLQLRVAHGLPLGGYIGTSIALRGAPPGPWTVWLALVEELPSGTEGTPVPRHLVRSLLQLDWSGRGPWREMRPLSIPAGAVPERLGVVGWVQDMRGVIVAITRSACGPDSPAR